MLIRSDPPVPPLYPGRLVDQMTYSRTEERVPVCVERNPNDVAPFQGPPIRVFDRSSAPRPGPYDPAATPLHATTANTTVNTMKPRQQTRRRDLSRGNFMCHLNDVHDKHRTLWQETMLLLTCHFVKRRATNQVFLSTEIAILRCPFSYDSSKCHCTGPRASGSRLTS